MKIMIETNVHYIKEATTKSIHIYVRSDGIIETKPLDSWNETEELSNAVENIRTIIDVSEGKLYPLLANLPNSYISHEARDYYRNHKPATKAVAMIVKNFVQQMLGNLFTRIYKLPVPTKLFTDQEKAVLWLHEFLDEDGYPGV